MKDHDDKIEQRYRLLVEAITDYAIYMLDPEGRITSWNPGAERLKGYTEQEIVGRHFSTFYTQEDRAEDLPARALDAAAREGRFEREGWRLRKDGSRFWANVIIDPIRDADGRLIGFAKITRDISEKRAAQEAIFQAQKMEAVGQLTGGLAHDFNNLLTAILGSLHIARKRAIREDVRDLIDNAIQGAQRGATLTQRLLAFSRRQELQLVAIDVVDLVHGMTELMRRTIGPEVLINTNFAQDLPKVRTDSNQLESALLNLVVNARDAMPDGGEIMIAAELETVTSGRRSTLPPGDYVRLSVRDQGEGMDAETLAKAATPFFTTKGVGKGTGLGLPMVHGPRIGSHVIRCYIERYCVMNTSDQKSQSVRFMLKSTGSAGIGRRSLSTTWCHRSVHHRKTRSCPREQGSHRRVAEAVRLTGGRRRREVRCRTPFGQKPRSAKQA